MSEFTDIVGRFEDRDEVRLILPYEAMHDVIYDALIKASEDAVLAHDDMLSMVAANIVDLLAEAHEEVGRA